MMCSKNVNSTTRSRLLMSLKKKAVENTVGKREMLVTSIFSFSHIVFYSIKESCWKFCGLVKGYRNSLGQGWI